MSTRTFFNKTALVSDFPPLYDQYGLPIDIKKYRRSTRSPVRINWQRVIEDCGNVFIKRGGKFMVIR